MADTLIICIGNDARGDDGAAHEVARLLAAPDAPGLPGGTRLVTATGLDFAMAQDVAASRTLVVVDAERRDAPAVEVRILSAGTTGHSGHAIDPPGLLALAQALYGAAPEAVLVSVAAPDMSHSQTLSETAQAASHEAAATVRSVVLGLR